MGTGSLIFEKWGHAALCIEYSGSQAQGICYNYGTTDFTRPIKVVWDFVRGEGLFWVSRDTPRRMIARYRSYDRSMWRQVLPLTPEQAVNAARTLAHAAMPENRHYIYHHFFDNCTTRIRDIIDEVTDGALRRDSSDKLGPTFRDYSRQGFAEMTWALIGTDYLLGRQADLQPDRWQVMFLPDFLRQHVTERLGAEPELVYERRGPAFSQDPGMGGRGFMFLLALLLAVPVAVTRWRGRFERLGIAAAIVPSFLFSFVVWGLPAISSLEALRYNEVLLVYCPLDLALLVLGQKRRQVYAQLRVAWLVAVSLLCAVGVFTQPLWAPIALVFVPLIVIAIPVFPEKSSSVTDDATGSTHRAGAAKSGVGNPGKGKKKGKKRR